MTNTNAFVLKSTTSANPQIQALVSQKGTLEKQDDCIQFTAESGHGILFYPKRTMGSITDIRSDEVSFETKNSIYVFERVEKREKLFDYHKEKNYV